MNLISQIKEIKNKISGQILFNESLSKYSWFNLGGPARVIFRPKNLNELSIFLKDLKGFDKIKVLGVGSNTLIRDGGFNGVIIKFRKNFSHISLIDENTLVAGASALDKNVSNFALENSLSGFEFLSCIPGTIGGGIRMNSGCYGEDISKILISVQVMDLDGKINVIHASNIKFSYRKCNLDNNLIFVSATFLGRKSKLVVSYGTCVILSGLAVRHPRRSVRLSPVSAVVREETSPAPRSYRPLLSGCALCGCPLSRDKHESSRSLRQEILLISYI